MKLDAQTVRAIVAYHLIETARKVLRGEIVDSGVDSGKKPTLKETAQPAVAVVPRPGLEPGTN